MIAELSAAERLARAMDNVLSGDRLFDRKLATQTRNELRRQDAKISELRFALSRTLAMLDELKAESGRPYDYGEEDPFRMGEWFEAEDVEAMEAARSILSEFGGMG